MGFGVHCGPAANLGLGFFLSSFILVLFALRFSEQRRMLRENCEGEDIFESKLFIKKKKKKLVVGFLWGQSGSDAPYEARARNIVDVNSL
jgi:hypothetical protein